MISIKSVLLLSSKHVFIDMESQSKLNHLAGIKLISLQNQVGFNERIVLNTQMPASKENIQIMMCSNVG